MSTLNVTSIGQTGFQWYISGLSNLWDSSSYTKACIGPSPVTDGQTTTPSTIWDSNFPPTPPGTQYSTTFHTALGFSANTSYTAYAFVLTPSGGWYNAGLATFTTLPNPPAGLTGLTVTGTGSGYVSLSWNASSGATSYSITWTPGSGSTSVSGTTATITGLTNGTSYTFTVTPTNSGGSGSSQSVSGTPNSRPANFDWDTPKVSGATFSAPTAVEWGKFQSRINDFRVYKGLTAYSFTSVSGTGMASDFNAARTAILAMSPPTAPPSAVVGKSTNPTNPDKVTAGQFNGIRDSLNSIT